MNPSNYPHGFHIAGYAPPSAPSGEYTKLPRQPTFRIYCEACKDLSVTVRNGAVVLATADSNDYYQHWIKDMRYTVNDTETFPAFALVNRVTGEALKTPAGENQPVTLVPYNTESLEESVKWSEVGSIGFRAVRITHTPSLNMTTARSDNFIDGTKITVKGWSDTPVQHWKIVPYNTNVPY